MSFYPLLMAPSFRHGEETPWGGTMLRDLFMKDAPDGIVGESLEISDLPGHESLVANGVHAGKPLSRMAALWGKDLTGVEGGDFALQLKLLDTQSPLSVQVHTDEPGAPGRTKAWVILNAEPDAKVVYGLDTHGEDLRAIVAEGRLEECLHWESARPGDVFYIPTGIVYALGGGIQCYEIQRTGAAPRRFWDWNRVNAQGQGRELHIEAALDAVIADQRPKKQEGTTLLCKGGSRTYYVADANFELCRLNVSGTMPLEGGRMRFLTPLAPCALTWGDGEQLELAPFDSVLIPAAMEDVAVVGDAKLMMSSPSDRPALIEALGYRAENVAGLVE